jgi:hypothetical protein
MTCSHIIEARKVFIGHRRFFMLSKSEDEGCHLLSLPADLERFEK